MTDNTATELAAVRAVVAPDSAMTRLMRLIGGSQTRINADRIAEASRDDLLLAVRALVATINETRLGVEKAGMHYQWMPLGDTAVKVEIEYESAEPRTRDYPGDAGCLNVVGVLINGVWCDPDEAVGEDKRAEWEADLAEQVAAR